MSERCNDCIIATRASEIIADRRQKADKAREANEEIRESRSDLPYDRDFGLTHLGTTRALAELFMQEFIEQKLREVFTKRV